MAPESNFTADKRGGRAPLTVNFTDLSIGNPTEWDWSFGDGILSDVQNPVHNYTAAGNYTVSLTVRNDGGSSTETKTDYIIVNVKGDFNGNGIVDIGDVSKVAYMVAEIIPKDPDADFNGNGIVDTGDAAMIAWYFVGLINSL
jgi:PKD repeat protein